VILLTPNPYFREAILYTYVLIAQMVINSEKKNDLKGQYISAQGKRRRSVALGWRTDIKIVRAIIFMKEKILFRTIEINLCFREIMSCNSVRNGLLALFIKSSRTVFLLHPTPRVSFRFVPPETLPWANLFWPVRPEKFCHHLVNKD
jgi:hypothetical protein